LPVNIYRDNVKKAQYLYSVLQINEKKVKPDIALPWNPISDLRGVTCHIGSHLPPESRVPTQVNSPCQTPAMQVGTRFTYPRGMEGWVDLVDLLSPQPGLEPATFQSWVRCSPTASPRQS